MAKHTPGPWRLEDDGIHFELVEPSISWMHSHSTSLKGRVEIQASEQWAEELANARLIAAAPELLDACKHMLACLDSVQTDDWPPRLDKLIRDAIAKAEPTA